MNDMIRIIYQDRRVLVAVKPCGVRSTDEPGGMPELLRQQLGEPHGCVRTVHRLDQAVGGLMVFARSAVASRELSRQLREHTFRKRYLAVIRGTPPQEQGTFTDLLLRDRAQRVTRVVTERQRGAQEAVLDYRLIAAAGEYAFVEIKLKTGRTHQIRVQFSSRGLPLYGDKKYGIAEETGDIGLWSEYVGFHHPESGAWMEFSQPPPEEYPWTIFPADR